MSDDRKRKALAAGGKLFEESEIRMDAEQYYDDLLKLADMLEEGGAGTESRQLVRDANAMFVNARGGLADGT